MLGHRATFRVHSRRIVRCALVAAAFVGGGCHRREVGEPVAMDAPVFVRVRNDAFLDANVFVVRSGQRYRLGTVGGHSTTLFRIPRGLVFGTTTLGFVADPIGASRTPVTEEISVSPGDEVTLQIPPT